MKIIMLGAPGAGKGTQAKKLAAKFNIPHISTGDIFRDNIKNKTALGKKVEEYIEKGLLVPDELVLEMIMDRLNEPDCKDGYVLDGFPRTIPQAKALDEALDKKTTEYSMQLMWTFRMMLSFAEWQEEGPA
jgi:Adenylate kinase (EC 2.7.4.3)